jgi:hypothetical protein
MTKNNDAENISEKNMRKKFIQRQKHTNQSEVYKQKNPRGVDHSGDSE